MPTISEGAPPRLEVSDGVARVTLQRPRYRNRLEVADLIALRDHFAAVGGDSSIRVLVLDAEVLDVRPVFCAGADLGGFDGHEPVVSLEEIMASLEALPVVTICALRGSVYGGASDFPLSCDLTVGAEGIEVKVPAAQLGLHYHPSGLIRYVRRIGVSAAKRAFLTAEGIDAESLLRIGFVQELCPPDRLSARVDELSARVAGLAPMALASLKASLNEISAGEVDMSRLNERFVRLKSSDDFAEGRSAFAERRAPKWKGC